MNNYWFSPKEIFVISLVVFFLYINPFSFFVLGFGGIPLLYAVYIWYIFTYQA